MNKIASIKTAPVTKSVFEWLVSLLISNELKVPLEAPVSVSFTPPFVLRIKILEMARMKRSIITKTPVKMAVEYILFIKMFIDSSGIIR